VKRVNLSLAVSALLLASAVYLKMAQPPFLADFQNRVFDTYQNLSPRPYEPVPVRIVDIDDETLERHGQWPWPRPLVGELIAKLTEAGASSIMLDIVFSEPDRTSPRELGNIWKNNEQLQNALVQLPDHDELLAKTIAESPVITGFVLTQDNQSQKASMPSAKTGISFMGENPTSLIVDFIGSVHSLPILEEAAKGNGALNSRPDRDGIVRSTPVVVQLNGKLYPSLGSEGLRVAQGASGSILKTVGGGSSGLPLAITAAKIGEFVIPTDAHGNQWLYYTQHREERYIPAWKVLDGSADSAKLEGNIILIGTSAAGLKDIRATPMSQVVPGVEIHAQALEQALLGISLERPDWIIGAEIALMLLASLVMLAVNSKLSPSWGASFMLFAIAATIAVSWYAFTKQHLLVEPVMPVATVFLIYFFDSLARYLRTERERQQIKTAFSQYMSPELVRELASQPEKLALGGEDKELSIMFCDMRDFTSISENLAPMELTRLMSEFLTPMTEIILSRQGTIDKYIGDCIMAFWNAPLDDAAHAQHAAEAALSMREALMALNEVRKAKADAQNQPFKPLAASISINSGMCCVGNMGTPQRFNYSALGDEVNLTSRLEGQTKYYGVDIILGEGTANKLSGLALLELDSLRVKGKSNAVRVYTLAGNATLAGDPAFIALAAHHQAMLASYRKQQWAQARQNLEACQKAAGPILPLLNQQFYPRYAERIEAYEKTPPPENWDGVYQVFTK